MVGTSNLGSWNSHWHNVSLNQPMDISYTKHLGVECGVLNLTQHGTGQNEVPKKVERNKINMKNSSIRGGPTGLTFHKCAFFLIWCLFSDMPGVFYGSPQAWKFRKKNIKSMWACLCGLVWNYRGKSMWTPNFDAWSTLSWYPLVI